MRTQQTIVARIEERRNDDLFGFETSEYLIYLDYEHAKPYLKEDATAEQWGKERKNVVPPRQAMIDYMDFAWEKAINCRSISASRSIGHYIAWLWLDGDDKLWPALMDDYEFYGKDQLVRICEYLGIDHKQWDDGIRVNNEEEYEVVMRNRPS